MRGHVRKRGSMWSYVVDIDKDPVSGKRRQREFSGFATEKEAERGLAKRIAEIDAGQHVDPSRETLAAYLERYTSERQIREGTRLGERQKTQWYIASHLGHLQLGQVKQAQITAFIGLLLLRGGVHGGPLAPGTVEGVLRTLRGAFRRAVKQGLIGRDPTVDVQVPSRTDSEIEVWQRHEAHRFLDTVRNNRNRGFYYTVFLLFLTTGLRAGEVLGLRWHDLQVEGRTLSVRRSRPTHPHGTLIAGPPKSRSSARTIGLDDATWDALMDYRVELDRRKIGCGLPVSSDKDFIFYSTTLVPLCHRTLYSALKSLCRIAKVPAVSLHGLRHTNATLSLASGMQIHYLSRRLGHSDVAVTLRTYAHVLPLVDHEFVRKAASFIAGLDSTGSAA